MDLLQHWRNITRDYHSPDSFITMGYYAMIGAALQRRVWTGSEQVPIYANQYNVLVGPPSVGKTLILILVKKCLTQHMLFPRKISTEQAQQLQNAAENLSEPANDAIKKMTNPPLMLPMAADSTTFESLVQELALATRTHRFEYQLADGSMKKELYFHNSICFALSELSDLFKKKVEDIIRFLQTTYDCQDFRHRTKTQGEDCIVHCCVNMLACATPKFIRDSIAHNLLGEGMASRIVFVYEEHPRHRNYDIPNWDESQQESYDIIIRRIKDLNKLYGRVTMTAECHEFARWWYENEHVVNRVNKSELLEDYYGRMRIHMDKLAMASHFGNSDDMVMQKESMETAIYTLQGIEAKMHLALTHAGKNPLYEISQNLMRWMKDKKEATQAEMTIQFIQDLPRPHTQSIVEILEILTMTKQLEKRLSMDGKPTKYVVGKTSVGSVMEPRAENGTLNGSQKVAKLLNEVEKIIPINSAPSPL